MITFSCFFLLFYFLLPQLPSSSSAASVTSPTSPSVASVPNLPMTAHPVSGSQSQPRSASVSGAPTSQLFTDGGVSPVFAIGGARLPSSVSTAPNVPPVAPVSLCPKVVGRYAILPSISRLVIIK